MAEKKKKKSVADSIINGTYEKDIKKESIADSIINGTYEQKILSSVKNKTTNNTKFPTANKTNTRIGKYTTSFPISDNINRNNVGNEQKKESKEIFTKLNPDKKLVYKKESENKTKKGNTASNILGNVGYGLANGLISLQQQFDRVVGKELDNRLHMGDQIDSKLGLPTVEERLKNILGENADKPITNIGDKLEEQKQTNLKNIQKNVDNTNNKIAKKIAEVAPSIGQMIPGMLPGIGSTYFTGSAAGNYYDEAKQRGMNEEEAEKYSAIMGLAEGATEMVGAKLTKSIGKDLLKGNTKQALKMFGLDTLENFTEEAVMEPLSEATAAVTAGKDKSNWSNIGKRMLESGIDGAIVSAIMGGASAGIGSSVNLVNKVANGEKIISRDVNNAKKDIQNNITDNNVQKKIQEAEVIINSINKDRQDNQANQLTQQITQEENNIVENNQKTLYNNYDDIALGEIINIPTNEVLSMQSDRWRI